MLSGQNPQTALPSIGPNNMSGPAFGQLAPIQSLSQASKPESHLPIPQQNQAQTNQQQNSNLPQIQQIPSGNQPNTQPTNIPTPQQTGQNSNQQLMQTAQGMVGQDPHSPALINFLHKANPNLDPNNTPWCAGFVGAVLNSSGIKGTGSLAAKSYLNYGTPTKNPTSGDIVVFNDLTANHNPAHGHVGFVQSIDQKNGTVTVIGGNQNHQVSSKTYPLAMVAGFRQPPSAQQIAQIAQQQGVKSPQDLSQLPRQVDQQDQQNRQQQDQIDIQQQAAVLQQ